jgi:hypothetical protein
LSKPLIEDYLRGVPGILELSDSRAGFERGLPRFNTIVPMSVRIFMLETRPVLFT